MSGTSEAKRERSIIDPRKPDRPTGNPVSFAVHSSEELAREVKGHIHRIDKKRVEENPGYSPQRKADIIPASRRDFTTAPWDVLGLLGRATALSSHGSSRALSQQWNSLKYISVFQENPHDRMELSVDEKIPEFFRKAVQAQDLGFAFGLATALDIAQRRHPEYRFDQLARASEEVHTTAMGPEHASATTSSNRTPVCTGTPESSSPAFASSERTMSSGSKDNEWRSSRHCPKSCTPRCTTRTSRTGRQLEGPYANSGVATGKRAEAQWAEDRRGLITMDDDGAVFGLRVMGTGHPLD